MTMTINLNILDPASIDAAIAKLRKAEFQLRRWETKTLESCGADAKAVADGLLEVAQFAGAAPDAVVSVGEVDAERYKWSVPVRMDGAHAGIIEFGSGIRFENAYQSEYGYFAGSYNPGSPYARQRWGWFYTGSPGVNPPEGTNAAYAHRHSVHTYGNPPNRVMWRTVNEMAGEMSDYYDLWFTKVFYD